MAQIVMQLPLAANVRVRSQVRPCRIGVSNSSNSIIQCRYHYANAQYSIIFYKRYNMTATASNVK